MFKHRSAAESDHKPQHSPFSTKNGHRELHKASCTPAASLKQLADVLIDEFPRCSHYFVHPLYIRNPDILTQKILREFFFFINQPSLSKTGAHISVSSAAGEEFSRYAGLQRGALACAAQYLPCCLSTSHEPESGGRGHSLINHSDAYAINKPLSYRLL